MNPPSILLDHASCPHWPTPTTPTTTRRSAIYRTMVEDFVAQRCLLVARADHLAAVANPDLFAPIDKLHIARQHRNAADELVGGTRSSTSTWPSHWC